MSDNGRDFWDASVALSAPAQKYHTVAAITAPYQGSPLQLSVFVSCYNEEAFITHTLDAVVEALDVVDKSYEIIVIDDHSTDRSAEAVRRYMENHPDLCIILRANRENKGLRANYLDAAFMGCGSYFCYIHGDNAEPLETLVDVLKATGEADIIVPYYVASSGLEGASLLAIGYTRMINAITGHRINYYPHSLHVHLRYNVTRWQSALPGLGFQTDFLCQMLDLGFTYKQVPCRAVPNRHNPIGLKGIFAAFHVLLHLTLRRLRA